MMFFGFQLHELKSVWVEILKLYNDSKSDLQLQGRGEKVKIWDVQMVTQYLEVCKLSTTWYPNIVKQCHVGVNVYI